MDGHRNNNNPTAPRHATRTIFRRSASSTQQQSRTSTSVPPNKDGGSATTVAPSSTAAVSRKDPRGATPTVVPPRRTMFTANRQPSTAETTTPPPTLLLLQQPTDGLIDASFNPPLMHQGLVLGSSEGAPQDDTTAGAPLGGSSGIIHRATTATSNQHAGNGAVGSDAAATTPPRPVAPKRTIFGKSAAAVKPPSDLSNAPLDQQPLLGSVAPSSHPPRTIMRPISAEPSTQAQRQSPFTHHHLFQYNMQEEAPQLTTPPRTQSSGDQQPHHVEGKQGGQLPLHHRGVKRPRDDDGAPPHCDAPPRQRDGCRENSNGISSPQRAVPNVRSLTDFLLERLRNTTTGTGSLIGRSACNGGPNNNDDPFGDDDEYDGDAIMGQFNEAERTEFRRLQRCIRPLLNWSMEDHLPPLNDQQQKIFKQVVRKRRSVFITGGAGTGKSVLLRHIVKALPRSTTAVTASTGVAALPLKGQTIHSWAGIGTGETDIERLTAIVMGNCQTRERIRRCRVLVVDEVSMISGSLFEKIEAVARAVRCNDLPFGGMQLVLCGDFLQLPPVTKDRFRPTEAPPAGSWRGGQILATQDEDDDEEETNNTTSTTAARRRRRPPLVVPPDIAEESKTSDFCFEASAWGRCRLTVHTLQTTFRQADDSFIKVLNELRIGCLSEHTCAVLLSHTIVPGSLVRSRDSNKLRLYAVCRDVDAENHNEFAKLHTTIVEYKAKDYFRSEFDRRKLAPRIEDDTRMSSVVRLRVGARVMLTKNVSVFEGMVNGRVGTVCGFLPSIVVRSTVKPQDIAMLESLKTNLFPVVKFDAIPSLRAAAATLQPSSLDTMEGKTSSPEEQPYTLVLPYTASMERNGVVVASRSQLPLIFGWALTIHKSQGMTLDRFDLHLERTFEHGQVYVALSRARSLDGVRLSGFRPGAVLAHPTALKFYQSCSNPVVKREEDGPRVVNVDDDDDEESDSEDSCSSSSSRYKADEYDEFVPAAKWRGRKQRQQ